jgi:hypothetical protein
LLADELLVMTDRYTDELFALPSSEAITVRSQEPGGQESPGGNWAAMPRLRIMAMLP